MKNLLLILQDEEYMHSFSRDMYVLYNPGVCMHIFRIVPEEIVIGDMCKVAISAR